MEFLAIFGAIFCAVFLIFILGAARAASNADRQSAEITRRIMTESGIRTTSSLSEEEGE